MLILYRLTSLFVALFTAGAFLLIIITDAHPIGMAALASVLVGLLFARLLRWRIREFEFWHLLWTPLLFLLSSFGLLLFLENFTVQLVLAIFATVFTTLFSEHVFSYVHLPSTYRAFSIEHLGQMMNILSLFFLGAVGFGLRLFLQLPLWVLGFVFFLLALFVIYGTLWASKVDPGRARPYALAGAVLMTELFLVISFLPSGFYTSAAFIALSFYIFLGLTRANAMHQLSRTVVLRYLLILILLVASIVLTSQWL